MVTSNLNRRDWLKLAGSAGLASMVLPSARAAVAAGGRPRQAAIANSPYSRQVLSLRPVGYWRLGETNAPTVFDLSGQEINGIYHCTPALGEPGAMRNDANPAIGLDGRSYVEIPDCSAFSIGAAGLTVQAWMRPDQLNFPCEGNAEYIYWLGKGETEAFEWGFRFYKKDSSRPNRISAKSPAINMQLRLSGSGITDIKRHQETYARLLEIDHWERVLRTRYAEAARPRNYVTFLAATIGQVIDLDHERGCRIIESSCAR